MHNFKKINEEEFFIIIDAPLYRKQCDTLLALLPDYVVSVDHDGYGSFVVELQPGVKQTDELYEEIWCEGEPLFFALHQSQTYDNFLGEAESVGEAWDWAVSILEQCGYDYTTDEIVEMLVNVDFPEADVERHATLDRLKTAA